MNRLPFLLWLGVGLLGWCGCAQRKPAATATNEVIVSQSDPDHFVKCHNGVVVSVSGPASDVGCAILKQGGNAVDAAIATALALQVSYPLAGNIGGGGFMLVHPAPCKGEPVVIDYRETAPSAARPTMYSAEESQFTHRAVAVPGTLRGLELAHKRFAKLSWRKLIHPAIVLARDGFIVDRAMADSMNQTLADSRQLSEFQLVYGRRDGRPWREGDRLIQAELARTLEVLEQFGPEAFYTGPIAEVLVAEMACGKGLITAKDLAGYRAIERKAISTRYRGTYDVYVPPPPCSGGVCLLEELNQLENFDLKSWERWSPQLVHIMTETMRRANYDRARYVGDPAFVKWPAKLISPEYGVELAKNINLSHATRSADLSTEIPMANEEPSTTHFSVIDSTGMAVANTYTLERRWGSRIVVRGLGFLLNNDMRAFNLFPGVTDSKGNVGTAPNVIAPGKRPISSMTPTIVARDGRVVLVTGSPGSRAIPHTVLEIMVNVLDFGMPIQTAVETPRFSQEWFPDHLSFEKTNLYPETVAGLTRLGHQIVAPGPLPFQGDAHTIFVEWPHEYFGVADHRINGKASGY